MTPPGPHLCAHVAYGHRALDIAYPVGEGTPSDPGPWWITSAGHRLRPYWTCDLAIISAFYGSGLLEAIPSPPDDHEESWSIDTRTSSTALLEALGLAPKPKPPIRRM